MTPALQVHWSRSKPNSRDCLSPLVCENLSGRQVEYASVGCRDVVADPTVKVFRDPGLLAPMLLRERPLPRRFRLGIVPHNKDAALPIAADAPRELLAVSFADLVQSASMTDLDGCRHSLVAAFPC